MNANPDLLKALNGLVKTFGHCNRLLLCAYLRKTIKNFLAFRSWLHHGDPFSVAKIGLDGAETTAR